MTAGDGVLPVAPGRVDLGAFSMVDIRVVAVVGPRVVGFVGAAVVVVSGGKWCPSKIIATIFY